MLSRSERYARRHFFACTLIAAALLLGLGATEARAETPAGGPVWAVGLSMADDNNGVDRDLTSLALGWRFAFDAPDSVAKWMDGFGLDLSFLVEPLFGVIAGETNTVEFAVVPMFRLESGNKGGISPFLEGGVGLIYNDLRGFDLGSRILFSDQIGAGIAFSTDSGRRYSVGYRLRHISHAGLWADANDGINTHFLTLTLQ